MRKIDVVVVVIVDVVIGSVVLCKFLTSGSLTTKTSERRLTRINKQGLERQNIPGCLIWRRHNQMSSSNELSLKLGAPATS